MRGTIRTVITLSALSFVLPYAQVTAFASTAQNYSTVRAELNGNKIPAIAVGNETYVLWTALNGFNTPYRYLGSGKFAITGGTVQGVIYHGDTYLPWADVAPKVRATQLHGGGFNFTSISVKHDYHIVFDTKDVPAGSPAPLLVGLMDGDAGVPSQTFQIQMGSASSAGLFSNINSLTDVTDENGLYIDALDDSISETVHPVITWTDPTGIGHTATVNVTFSSPNVITPFNFPNETTVTTVPTTTYYNGIYFKAKSGSSDILFQLDTGAFAILLPKQLAESLQLPNLGDTELEGIGGPDEGYVSKISLTIGGTNFNNIPCVVSNRYTGAPLFGYKFFVDNGYNLLVSQKDNTITILK